MEVLLVVTWVYMDGRGTVWAIHADWEFLDEQINAAEETYVLSFSLVSAAPGHPCLHS